MVNETDSFTTLAAAIRGRRNVKRFSTQPVPRSLVEQLVELAVWAPNHKLTEPWRFYVLGGQVRPLFAAVAAAVTERKALAKGGDPAAAARKGAEAAATWQAVPVLLYVTYVTSPNPVTDRENYGAVCCAVQNLMLAAHAAGLATSWSSGALAGAPELHELAGAGDDERMVGLFRLGYPDPDAPTPIGRRAPGASVTRWVGE